MRICVFGAASPTIDSYYIDQVERLGEALARGGHELVFGGGGNGLMGAAARGAKAAGGKVTGVVPKFFSQESIEAICAVCDELIQPDTMRERKAIMEDISDVFIVVPGGIGTFEEFFEVLTLKQLGRHNKPIIIYNLLGYFDPLISVMESSIEKGFIHENCRELYAVRETLEDVLTLAETPPAPHRPVRELKKG